MALVPLVLRSLALLPAAVVPRGVPRGGAIRGTATGLPAVLAALAIVGPAALGSVLVLALAAPLHGLAELEEQVAQHGRIALDPVHGRGPVEAGLATVQEAQIELLVHPLDDPEGLLLGEQAQEDVAPVVRDGVAGEAGEDPGPLDRLQAVPELRIADPVSPGVPLLIAVALVLVVALLFAVLLVLLRTRT